MPTSEDLISSGYRELNRELHSRSNYGVNGFRWAEQITELLIRGSHATVLDYGCGQGSLKRMLDLDGVHEYDPAIAGKDALPEPADFIVCTDVLEHIEPERIDAVLDHLTSLTRRDLFVVISTRKAFKKLADGRNAHLIVESPDWWREKLESRFIISSWTIRKDDDEVVGLLKRKLPMPEIHGKSAMTDEARYEHAKINIPKVSKRLPGLIKKLPVGHSIICAYGPSLTKTWETIEKEREVFINSEVVSVSGAHDFLIERGVIPDYHVEVDPREHKATFTKNSHPDVKYLMASCCHPKTIDQLLDAGRDVTLFHVFNGEYDLNILRDFEPEGFLLSGGGSVGLRAFSLRFSQGFRSFSLRGMDSSYDIDAGGQHAGYHTGKVHSEIDAQVGGRTFKSSYIMIAYARFFFATYKQLSQICSLNGEEPNPSGEFIDLNLMGDGLLQAMAREIVAGRVEPEEDAA